MAAPKLRQSIIVHYVAYDVELNLRRNIAFFHDDQGVAVKALKAVNGYIPVARVVYDPGQSLEANLEHAYRLMQNGIVSESWTLSPPADLLPLVEPISEDGMTYGHRSADVGDLFEIGGNQYVVAAVVGFRKLD